MNKFTLSLTPEQINIVFAALGKMPFETVFNLINEMNTQVSSQVSTNSEETLVSKTLPSED